MNYDFSKMSPELFEQMVRSLMEGKFGIQCKQYGAGPDGQRDFVLEGTVELREGDVVKGRTFGQVKYKDVNTRKDDYDWLVQQISKELQNFQKKEKDYIPDNYLFCTNIVLTPKKDDGIKDKIEKYVEENNTIIKNFYVWGYDDICAMLDNNRDVAVSYLALILPGDLIAEFLKKLKEGKAETSLPDGNVIHNGHIEYLPSLIEATPFNYIYFLVSGRKEGMADSLKELLSRQSCQGHVWREYTVQSFLDGSIEDTDQEDKMGLLVYMDVSRINNIGLLIQQWRKVACDTPIIVNVYVKDERFMEAAEGIRTALCEIDWGREFNNKQTEINSLILVQTNRFSARQNIEDVGESSRDELERWRILLSDRYYFRQVLKYYRQPLVKHLLCQRIPVCKSVKCVEADRRLLQLYDREKFIKQKYEWESDWYV